MNESLNAMLIFKNKEFQINIQPKDYKNLHRDVLLSLLMQHKYEIQSEVSEEVFQSFIDYFNNGKLPDVQTENIDEYNALGNELQINTISNIIQQKRDLLDKMANDLSVLCDDSIKDKSDVEHRLSQNLDYYVKSKGDELINSPIQSLYNIFSYKDRNFTAHNQLYNLVMSHYEKTNQSDIFVLLQFIEGDKISDENLVDSFMNESLHFYFRPIYTISSLQKIYEIESPKKHKNMNLTYNQKDTKINQNQKIESNNNSNNDSNNDTENNNNYTLTISDEIVRDGIKFNLNKSKMTAEVTFPYSFRDEVHVPRSIIIGSDEYIIKEFGYLPYQNINILSLIISEDSEIQFLDLCRINCPNLKKISISPSIKKIYLDKNSKNLSKIYLSQQCKYFKWIDDAMLLGKSDEKSDEFDVLVFADKTIENITIPSYVKHIGSYAFHSCLFKTIKIPTHVTTIGDFAFEECKKLVKVDLSEDFELVSIGKGAYNSTLIEAITIPSDLKTFEIGKTHLIKEIKISPANINFKLQYKMLLGKSDENLDDFDLLIYAFKDIEYANIPSNIKRICPYCFYNCQKLKKVEFLPDSQLISIGEGSFNSTAISSISIPLHVAFIDDNVFDGCGTISNVNLSNNSELISVGIGPYSFGLNGTFTIPLNLKSFILYRIDEISNIIIPPSNKNYKLIENKMLVGKSDANIDDFDLLIYAFKDIEYVQIPSNIKRICPYCFYNCQKLKKVEFLPDSQLISIGKCSFMGSLITSIAIPKNVAFIEDQAFCHSYSIENVEFAIDSELVSIGMMSFYSCYKLKSLDFSKNNKLSFIGKDAFSMGIIEKIVIQSNVENIYDGNSFGVDRIVISQTNKHFKMINNNLIIGKSDENSDEFDVLVYARRKIEYALIPSNIKHISPYCFNRCNSLQKIEFPPDSKLVSIGSYSFQYSSIESITIPPHVTYIGDFAFNNCSKLHTVEIPDKSELASIKMSAFERSDIQHITIPPQVTVIEESAFKQCTNLKTVVFSSNSKLHIIEKNSFASCSNLQEIDLSRCSELITIGKCSLKDTAIESIIIPPKVTSIEDSLFESCTKLQEIEFSENSDVTTIGYKAFYFCSINTITIPSNVITIKKDAFSNCSRLHDVVFSNNSKIRTIEKGAFNYTQVKLFTIPPNVEVFKGFFCWELNLNVSPKNKNFKWDDGFLLGKSDINSNEFDTIVYSNKSYSIKIPSYIKYIGNYCFSKSSYLQNIEFESDSKLISFGTHALHHSKLNTIKIPKHVKIISDYAFFSCSELKKIEFDNDSELQIIGEGAFQDTALQAFKVPPHVTSIEKHAFFNCKNLYDVTFSNYSNFISIDIDSFDSLLKGRIKLPPH